MKNKTILIVGFLAVCILIGIVISFTLLKKPTEKIEAKPKTVIKTQPIAPTRVTVPTKVVSPTQAPPPKPTIPPAAPPPVAPPRPVTITPPVPPVEVEPTDAKGFYDRGVRLYYSGKYDDAINDFNKAISIEPNFAEAYCELGVTTMEKGNFKAAIGYLEKSVQLKPDYPKSNYALAVCYARIEPPDTVNARKYLEAAKALGYLVPPWFEDFLKRLEEKKIQ